VARSDDLSPLFAGGRPVSLGFRQGVVVAWDGVTFANEITIGDFTVTNLPVLNLADNADIVPGDAVGIFTFGPTWAVLGRFTVPS
jgi:hypothetical protein